MTTGTGNKWRRRRRKKTHQQISPFHGNLTQNLCIHMMMLMICTRATTVMFVRQDRRYVLMVVFSFFGFRLCVVRCANAHLQRAHYNRPIESGQMNEIECTANVLHGRVRHCAQPYSLYAHSCTFWLMNGVASTKYLLLHFFTKSFLHFIGATRDEEKKNSKPYTLSETPIGVVMSIRFIIYYM